MVSDNYDRSYDRNTFIEDWIDELENYLLARHGTVDDNGKRAAVKKQDN